MKENYLWNKTGEDAEIERMEKALQVFRYQETMPPALPAKIIPFKRKSSRGIFRLSFAFASFAVLIIVCLTAWFQFSINKIEVAKDSTEIISIRTATNETVENSLNELNNSTSEKLETQKQIAARKIVKIRKIVPSKIHLSNSVTRSFETKKPALKLTKEEKHAYDQLMLALSITSSKLKLVKDKVGGIEEKNAALENAR